MRDWRTHMRSFSCHAVTTGITSSTVSSLKIALHASALSLSLWRMTGTCHKAHQQCSPTDAVFFARKQHSHTALEEGSRAQKPHVKPPGLLLRVNFWSTYHGQISLYSVRRQTSRPNLVSSSQNAAPFVGSAMDSSFLEWPQYYALNPLPDHNLKLQLLQHHSCWRKS